ncbi:MAG: Protein QmcA [bacterium]|nr:Protein QmcA [bacterium]MCK6562075.1 paraslipin [bacterium]NUM64323.1 paraslipin [candidate division KSB1 bacterium]
MNNVERNTTLCFLLTLVTLGVRKYFSVPQGYVCLITALGKYLRTAGPGLGSCLSFWGLYERPSAPVPVKEQVKDYPREDVFTRDGVRCTIDTVVYFKITDPVKASFDIDNYETAILQLVRATLRNECGDFPAMELLAGRRKLIDKLRSTLETETRPWGITVRLVEITEIILHDRQ